jgi:hypothetical protein
MGYTYGRIIIIMKILAKPSVVTASVKVSVVSSPQNLKQPIAVCLPVFQEENGGRVSLIGWVQAPVERVKQAA